MLDWLVITADMVRGGRGVRGNALTWFLESAFGRRNVRQQTPDEARQEVVSANTLFVGLPSSLTAVEIERLCERTGCRRVLAFDYRDRHELAWNESQEAMLRPRVRAYLKPWFEQAWGGELRRGLLPVRANKWLQAAARSELALQRAGLTARSKYDVAFLGMPNRTRIFIDGRVRKIDQRVEWIRQIKSEAPELKFWGGLIRFGQRELLRLQLAHGEVDDLYYVHPKMHRKISFLKYWRAIRRSRVLLAPGGNVPWTYRHYEVLYAGGVVVSNDFREREMLVPLPLAGMIQVPDEAPVLPAVREALARQGQRRELAQANFAHLEQFFRLAGYGRKRPKLAERFLEQIE